MRWPGKTHHATTTASADCVTMDRMGSTSVVGRKKVLLSKMRSELMMAEQEAVTSGSRKNDAADAAAICEALQRPNMRFVPVKSLEQQATLTLHRVRQGFVEQRTALINRVRGLLSEFGIVMPLKASTVRHQPTATLEDLP